MKKTPPYLLQKKKRGMIGGWGARLLKESGCNVNVAEAEEKEDERNCTVAS